MRFVMIPTDLPPNTEIICIDNKPNIFGHPCPLIQGALYSVRGYSLQGDGTVSVLLNEILAPVHEAYNDKCERGFYRWRFRIPLIPKIFYEMLETKKIDIPEEETIDLADFQDVLSYYFKSVSNKSLF